MMGPDFAGRLSAELAGVSEAAAGSEAVSDAAEVGFGFGENASFDFGELEDAGEATDFDFGAAGDEADLPEFGGAGLGHEGLGAAAVDAPVFDAAQPVFDAASLSPFGRSSAAKATRVPHRQEPVARDWLTGEVIADGGADAGLPGGKAPFRKLGDKATLVELIRFLIDRSGYIRAL